MSNNKGKKAAHLAQVTASSFEREQQRQTDVVAASITNPVNQGGVDATDLTTALLSSVSDQENPSELERSVTLELPSSSSGQAKIPTYSSRRQREEEERSELPSEPSLQTAVTSSEVPSAVINDEFITPDQVLPAFVRSTSTSPKRKRGSALTYAEFLAQQAPPPPPLKETRDDRRRKIAFTARVNATAEKTKALLVAKGKVNPTDDDLIAAINKLENFDKRQKLTSSQTNRQAKEQERLQKLPALIFPRRAVDLQVAEQHYGPDRLQEFFDRCVTCKSDHARRKRETTDLPDDFFTKEYHHGKWIVDATGVNTSWRPFFYPHGYFDGEDGRWIGNLTPDKKRIYRRDGTVGPEYSGFN